MNKLIYIEKGIGRKNMFTRQEYKKRAWQILSKSYWIAFLMCLIYAVVTGGINFSYNYNRNSFSNNDFGYSNFNPFIFLSVFLMLFCIGFVIGAVFALFLVNPLTVSKSKFFINNSSGKGELETIFYSFKKGKYLNIVGTMGWRSLIIILWSLLFIIPGIIKGYAYCLVPYILADNPNINYKDALRLSNEMTKGYKFDIFVLQLSFIGWYLLGLLCCCIGVFFVTPYYEQTFAEMYISLRTNAIHSGYIHRNELNLPPEDIFYNEPML